jgi:retron-type reverse transcriptase
MERRGCVKPLVSLAQLPNGRRKLSMEAKQFNISKWEVKHAYELVKANKGSAGVDNQSIEGFERDLKGNLYKIWNRLSSGTYFPPRAGSRIFSANYIIIINFLNFFEFR